MMLWSEFHTIVTAELPGVPSPVIDQYARLVSIDFCETTQIHVAMLDAIDVTATVSEYSLDGPSSATTVSNVVQAWYLGSPLKFIPIAQLRRTGNFWPDISGAVEGFTQTTADNLILYPKPLVDGTAALNISATLKPSLRSTGLEEWIANRYFYDIANGVKAKLMGMLGQTWANKEGAVLYDGLYRAAMSAASDSGGRNVQRARLTD